MSSVNHVGVEEAIQLLYPPQKEEISINPGDEFCISNEQKPKMVGEVWLIVVHLLKRMGGVLQCSDADYQSAWQNGDGAVYHKVSSQDVLSFHKKWLPTAQEPGQTVLFKVISKLKSKPVYYYFNVAISADPRSESTYQSLVNERIKKQVKAHFEGEAKEQSKADDSSKPKAKLKIYFNGREAKPEEIGPPLTQRHIDSLHQLVNNAKA